LPDFGRIVPRKLRVGDNARVIAPSRSLALKFITQEARQIATERFGALGLAVSYGNHAYEMDEFGSTSPMNRVQDITDAFLDGSVGLITTAIGGYNSNQLLRMLDYDLIKSHPKIFVSRSDVVVLLNAIFERTRLVTYLGPHFFNFGEKLGFDYTLQGFRRCLFGDARFTIDTSSNWSDDYWSFAQESRTFIPNRGPLVIREGQSKGTLIGGQLSAFNLLNGTEFAPSLDGRVLAIDEDEESTPALFDRHLQCLLQQPHSDEITGLLIGRFPKGTKMSDELLVRIIQSKNELREIPIVANLDFSHTTPIATMPIGGEASIIAEGATSQVEFTVH
jgi:muramoyltetrapeptide carboxypeptidase LdcA involved in peptidoglycan recycling